MMLFTGELGPLGFAKQVQFSFQLHGVKPLSLLTMHGYGLEYRGLFPVLLMTVSPWASHPHPGCLGFPVG